MQSLTRDEVLRDALRTIVNDCNMILRGDDMSGMSDAEIFSAMRRTCLRALRYRGGNDHG